MNDKIIILVEGKSDIEVAYSFVRRFNFSGNFQNYPCIRKYLQSLAISNMEMLNEQIKTEKFISGNKDMWELLLINAIFLNEGKPYHLQCLNEDEGYKIIAYQA